jgi:hypothetical protein
MEKEKLSRFDERINELKLHTKQLEDDRLVLIERKQKIEHYIRTSGEDMEKLKKDMIDLVEKRQGHK